MKMFLTGEPGIGKSTLIGSVLEKFTGPKTGFLTRERRVDGERRGFELVSSTGVVATLASTDSDSAIKVS